MSCNTCQTKFTLFTKENGCPSCGFSYCSKCLKYKCEIQNIGIKKVCGKCYNKLRPVENSSSATNLIPSSEMDNLTDKNLTPVDITKKLDSLENPAKPPIVMYKQTNHWDKFKKGLEPADQEIVERLRRLKEENSKNLPSVDDIRRRLALLKDQDPDSPSISTNVHHVDTRTDQQKTNDLIREYLETLKLTTEHDSCKEIEDRLKALKGEKDCGLLQSENTVDDEEDEGTLTKKIIKKAIAEAAIEAKYEDVDELEEMEVEPRPYDSNEDKPQCVMCDQTADLIQCTGCSGDLYCPICFEDNHDDFEMKKHKRIPFTYKPRLASD